MVPTSQMLPNRGYQSTFHGKLPDRSSAPSGGVQGGPGPAAAASVGAGFGGGRPQDRDRGNQGQAQTAAQTQTASGAAGLSDEQRDEVNEAFALFDLDRDQRIDYHEFKVALKALGFDLPKQELISLLTTHGSPPLQQSPVRGPVPPSRLQLTLPAFMTIASGLIQARDPLTEIYRAFELFDTNNKGMITLDDLRRVARELGEGLEEDELRSMIEEFDLEGKGGVGRDEFVSICMG